MNELLKRLKTMLRISEDELDDELSGYLLAAQQDLIRAGVSEAKLETALGEMAMLTYARASARPGEPEYANLMESYATLCDSLRRNGA